MGSSAVASRGTASVIHHAAIQAVSATAARAAPSRPPMLGNNMITAHKAGPRKRPTRRTVRACPPPPGPLPPFSPPSCAWLTFITFLAPLRFQTYLLLSLLL